VSCERFEEQVWLAIDDELAADERRELDAHLAVCAACRAKVEAARSVAHRLRTLQAPAAPKGFKETTLARLEPATVTRISLVRRWWQPLAAAAALLIVVGVRAMRDGVEPPPRDGAIASSPHEPPAAAAPDAVVEKSLEQLADGEADSKLAAETERLLREAATPGEALALLEADAARVESRLDLAKDARKLEGERFAPPEVAFLIAPADAVLVAEWLRARADVAAVGQTVAVVDVAPAELDELLAALKAASKPARSVDADEWLRRAGDASRAPRLAERSREAPARSDAPAPAEKASESRASKAADRAVPGEAGGLPRRVRVVLWFEPPPPPPPPPPPSKSGDR